MVVVRYINRIQIAGLRDFGRWIAYPTQWSEY